MMYLSLVLLICHLSFSFGQDVISATINLDNNYLIQKACVKNCIWEGEENVMLAIGCSSPWVNDCLCRVDQAPPASSFLTTCVRSSCGVSATDDVSRAVSVYDGYCSGAGYMHVQGQEVPAETTSPNSNPQVPTVTQVTFVTETAKASNAGSQTLTTPGEFGTSAFKLFALTGAVTVCGLL